MNHKDVLDSLPVKAEHMASNAFDCVTLIQTSQTMYRGLTPKTVRLLIRRYGHIATRSMEKLSRDKVNYCPRDCGLYIDLPRPLAGLGEDYDQS